MKGFIRKMKIETLLNINVIYNEKEMEILNRLNNIFHDFKKDEPFYIDDVYYYYYNSDEYIIDIGTYIYFILMDNYEIGLKNDNEIEYLITEYLKLNKKVIIKKAT